MFLPPPSPGLLQSKHAQARGKKGLYEEDYVAKSELILNEKQQEQQNPSHLSDIRSHRYPGSRRAFQAVENIIHGSNGHLSSSASVSIEAPKGCLKLLLSHCSYSSSPAATGSTSKTALNRRCHTKTPKSARVSRLPRSKPFCLTKENSSSASVSNKLNRVKSSKSSKSSTSETPAVFNPVVESHSEESEELRFTPMAASKIASCSVLDHLAAGNGNLKNRLVDDEKSNTSSSKSKTPPLQASFSPEIQCTATMATLATTPACYGAGHLISGVTDKRKCRARGVLAVVRSRPNNEKSNTSSSDTKTPPLQASFSPEIQSTAMATTPACYGAGHLLSGVTDKRKCRARGVLAVAQAGPIDDGILSNGSNDASFEEDCDAGLDNKFSASINDTSDATNSGTGKSQRSTNSMLISTQGPRFGLSLDCSSSPNVTPYSGLIPPKEEENHGYNIDGRNSPLSADTLGSENVMQTPKSDSSLERPVMLSCSRLKDHKRPHHLHSELLSITEDLRMASLSPESHLSICDTNSSSIKFDRLSTPSDSMDLSRFQKILYDRYLWNSNSTFEDVSQSELRISWREGLASRIFEMDEFDSCRCLSDEEEDLNVDAGNVPTIKNGDGNKEKLHSPLQCSYAESIATDGGGLAQSTDSDWNLCYKNNLFQV
ncbi:hypothetical protein Godav_022444 [Gossypium davidsonii]|uniref:Uncharacterized protein n=1 Tax=Gossypium davidsonii TaxID=34287 RepID=A0A7J8SQ23_GOSDV|nr:hypothetical protein [Gossypium davidsonii]